MKICALIPTHPHVRNSTHNSRLNVSRYFGLRIVLNEIKKHYSIDVPLVTYESVHKFDIVLVSIHSVEDFWAQAYTFYNRLKGQRKGIWIAGGSAVQNINPLVEMFDHIVIGRAENIIIPLLQSVLNNIEFVHESVVNTCDYHENKEYKISYVEELYKEKIGKEKETMLGCKYNCAYCRYRIASKPPNMRKFDKLTTMPGNEETFWELDIKSAAYHTTSLDGLTERIRFAVTKHISNQAIIDKFREFSKSIKRINLKVYLIVGYPHNPELNFNELKEVFTEISEFLTDQKYVVRFHMTPFSAEPGTPMQWEKVNIEQNYNQLMKEYRQELGSLVHTDSLQAYVQPTVMSNYAVLRRSIHHRASLLDLDLIRYLAADPFFRSHNNSTTQKLERILSTVNIDSFIREYPIGSILPSSNIISWRNQQSIMNQGAKVRRKLKEIGIASVLS